MQRVEVNVAYVSVERSLHGLAPYESIEVNHAVEYPVVTVHDGMTHAVFQHRLSLESVGFPTAVLYCGDVEVKVHPAFRVHKVEAAALCTDVAAHSANGFMRHEVAHLHLLYVHVGLIGHRLGVYVALSM